MVKDISVPYSFRKQGIYYFERRVPRDLLKSYDTLKISFSLRTRSAPVAAARARGAAMRLDEYWYHLRLEDAELPSKHRLRLGVPNSWVGSVPAQIDTPRLSEAASIYLRLKGVGRPRTFGAAAERACGYLIDVCGDKYLSEYTRADATAFRDYLVTRRLAGSSISRVIGTVRSIVNFASTEAGIQTTNPFSGLYFDRKAGVTERIPIPSEAIRRVQRHCMVADDDLRWLIALVSDTGLRLSEAAGLHVRDFVLDERMPRVVVLFVCVR